MRQHIIKGSIFWAGALIALLALGVTACAGGVAQKDYDAVKAQLTAKEQDVAQLQKQMSAIAPSTTTQVGQLQPAPAGAQAAGWDTAESIRGGLKLYATYDSSGPDAWDPVAHPLVYFTSEGRGYSHRPAKDNKLGGVQVIDGSTKQVITSALFNMGRNVLTQPHGLGISPDGKWLYIGEADQDEATKETRNMIYIVNARTLKLEKVLIHPVQRLHHIMGFTDWQSRDRVLLTLGYGATGGPYFVIDPKDNHKVVRAITYDDVRPIGHPYPSPDPTGKFLYVSMDSPEISEAHAKVAAMAKVNLETGAVIVIEGVGNHPVGVSHSADGKFTYVNDGKNSLVYKIDNTTNKVVGSTSAGVAGPYGNRLNWDETLLYTVGKGEGSHNTGGVLGVIDLKTFKPTNTINQPVNIGGATMDHGILHPDPEANELWVSSAGTWETIVVDLKTNAVKARIPSPHGGDTHSGGFVRYKPDFSGELLSDMGGPHKTVYEIIRGKVAAAKR